MTKAVFYGASGIEGVGASSPAQRFSSIISRVMGWEECNLGIGGTPVTGRDDSGMIVAEDSGIGRVPDVVAAAPGMVFILYGANDFVLSVPIGDPQVFRQGTFYWDFDTMLRGIKEALPAAQIVLSTPTYRADANTPNVLGLILDDYTRVMRQMADRYDLCLLDAFAESGIDAQNFSSLAADECHLNDAGQERLAAFYLEGLRKVCL